MMKQKQISQNKIRNNRKITYTGCKITEKELTDAVYKIKMGEALNWQISFNKPLCKKSTTKNMQILEE